MTWLAHLIFHVVYGLMPRKSRDVARPRPTQLPLPVGHLGCFKRSKLLRRAHESPRARDLGDLGFATKNSPILASWWVSPYGPEIGFSKGWTSVLKPDWSERLWTEASREENFRTRWPGTGRIVRTLILMLNFDFYFIHTYIYIYISFKFWFLNFQLCMVIFGGVLKACSSFWPHWTCPLNVASGISRHLSMTSRSARVANSFLPPIKPYPSLFQLTW